MHSAITVDNERKDAKLILEDTDEAQDLEMATNTVLERIAAEPAYENVLYRILVFCETGWAQDELINEILTYPEMRTSLFSPETFLSWLEEAGGLEKKEIEEDEYAWFTTTAGRNAVERFSEENRLKALLAKEEKYRDVFIQVLEACLAPKSRMDIEKMLNGNPLLEKPKVYASFFIESLEKAGGLVWDQKWKTTKAGKEFLKSVKK